VRASLTCVSCVLWLGVRRAGLPRLSPALTPGQRRRLDPIRLNSAVQRITSDPVVKNQVGLDKRATEPCQVTGARSGHGRGQCRPDALSFLTVAGARARRPPWHRGARIPATTLSYCRGHCHERRPPPRGPGRGPAGGVTPAQQVPSVRCRVLSVQPVRTLHGNVLMVRRRSTVRFRNGAP
jgi:hypothetical protein